MAHVHIEQLPDAPSAVNWSGVAAMTLAVMAVMTAELLPVGLLTLIAHDLQVTTGTAGQTLTATAIAGIVTGILISPVTRRFDRRNVILALGVLLIGANLLVAAAVDMPMLFLGRVFVGVAHGGLWSLAPATALRLAPPSRVPRIMAIIFAGISAAITFTTPLGSYLGELFGWRGAFFMSAGVAAVVTLALFMSLPRMATSPAITSALPFRLLGEPHVALGMAAVILVFMGHYAFFTYIRPFIEHLPGMGRGSVPLVLFCYGIANFIGVTLAGKLLADRMFATLVSVPIGMAAIALLIFQVQSMPVAAAAMVVAWGFLYGMVPVGWNTWVARTSTSKAEGAGGLLVACIQTGIAAGSGIGGVLFDNAGLAGAFRLSGLILLLTGAAAWLSAQAWKKAAVASAR